MLKEHLVWENEGINVLETEIVTDQRGFFKESFNQEQLNKFGIDFNIKQINHSGSEGGTIRGLHFQYEKPQAKIMQVILGKAFLVAVDIRPDSPEFGKWYGKISDDEDNLLIYTEAGFARGFKALSSFTEIQYFCNNVYNPDAEGNIIWDDPDINIIWPESPEFFNILSHKDKNAPSFKEVSKNKYFNKG